MSSAQCMRDMNSIQTFRQIDVRNQFITKPCEDFVMWV
jgi:hypothetical protein